MFLFLVSMLEEDRDREIFEKIYIKYLTIMRNEALACTKKESITEDLVQESFIKVINNFELFKTLLPPQQVTYLRRTVHSVSIDYLRANKAEMELVSLDDSNINEQDVDDYAYDPLDLYMKNATYEKLGNAMLRLSPQERLLIQYRYFHNLSEQQLADTLRINKRNISSYISRAKKRLAQLVEEEEQK